MKRDCSEKITHDPRSRAEGSNDSTTSPTAKVFEQSRRPVEMSDLSVGAGIMRSGKTVDF